MAQYEFLCPVGHIIEREAPMTCIPKHVICRKCGKKAKRIVSLTGRPVVKGGTPRFYN